MKLLGRFRKPKTVPVRAHLRVTASAVIRRADGTVEQLPPADMGLINEEQAMAMVGDLWQRS